MNYLAHAFLSGRNRELLVGNFIADGLRGNNFEGLSPGIISGIYLHRFIDSFTDDHPVNVEARRLLQPVAGKFAGVVLDIFYDHLLAVNWHAYSADHLKTFVSWCYGVIEDHEHLLPPRSAQMFPYMREGDWLFNYSREEGIMRSLRGLSVRIPSRPDLPGAGELAFREIKTLEGAFLTFFPELLAAKPAPPAK